MATLTLTKDKLRSALLGRPFRYYPALASTNDEALAWLQDGAEEGSLVISDHQTSGRGRQGRGWYTPPASALTLSIILRCSVDAAQQSTMLAAVAVYELLDELGISEIGIKWPNDVQIGPYKVCGILPEALWNGEEFSGVVLGIGLNVRADFVQTPLAKTAISLETASQFSYDRCDLLRRLLAITDCWRPHLGSATLFRAWRARLNSLGRPVKIGELSGIASAVDESGALWLDLPEGRQERILAGTLQEWRGSE